MRILFIEDDENSVLPMISVLESNNQHQCKRVDFDNYKDELDIFRPNLIILDLFSGAPDPSADIAGQPIYEKLWECYYCPVIVYSAHPEYMDTAGNADNPFLRLVVKGSKINKLVDEINQLAKPVEAVEKVYSRVNLDTVRALRHLAPVATFTVPKSEGDLSDKLVRAGRRRIAAIMDEPVDGGRNLAEWEIYIWPPLNVGFPLMGDVLRQKDADPNNPNSYRIVLTPSCDLVKTEKRDPKVDSVLVAKCCTISEGLSKTSLRDVIKSDKDISEKIKELKKKLPDTAFTEGWYETVLFYPALADHFPELAVSLRDLELVPYKSIGIKDKDLIRIASVDSPFRERISWAFIRVAGRPGVPDLDRKTWKKNILNQFKKEFAEEQ